MGYNPWGRKESDTTERLLCVCVCVCVLIWGFPGGSDGKTSACNAGDPGSIPGSGRSLGEGNPLSQLDAGKKATHSSVLVWRIPWMEEPGGLQSMGSQRVGHD